MPTRPSVVESPGDAKALDLRDGMTAVTLALAAVLLRLPGLDHEFIVFDDYVYVLRNPLMQAPWGAVFPEILTSITAGLWHPLTLLSLKLDVTSWGLRAGPIVIMNAAFHALNAALVFLLLRRLRIALPPALAAASLFAFHPAHVESYAWVSERKDVLSAAFFLLAFHSWLSWRQRRAAGPFIATLALFAAGLLAKPVVVTLPAVLVLFELCAGERSGRLRRIAATLPLFLLSAVASAMTIHAQSSHGAVRSLAVTSVWQRLSNAIGGYAWYLETWVWPSELSVFHRHGDPSSTTVLLALGFLLGVSALAFRFRRRPLLPFGWFWFCGVLFPMAGVVQVGLQSVADRYLYLPAVGLILILAALAQWLGERHELAGRIVVGAVVAAGVSFAILSTSQFRLWRTSESITAQAARNHPDSGFARFLYGMSLAESGRCDGAIGELEASLQLARVAAPQRGQVIESWAATSLRELARCRRISGLRDEALDAANRAVLHDPRDAAAWLELGDSLLEAGRTSEAEKAWSRAESLRAGLGVTLSARRVEAALRERDFVRAEELARRSVSHEPSSAAWIRLGRALSGLNRTSEALEAFERAVAADPRDAEAQLNAGLLRAATGDAAGAARGFEEAVRLDPARVDARIHLALMHAGAGRDAQALDQLHAALRQDAPRARHLFLLISGLDRSTHSIEGYIEYLRERSGQR